MRKFMAALLILVATGAALAQDGPQRFRVVAWNILHGAGDIDRGLESVVEILRCLDPDVVLLVETYGSGPAIAEALDLHFHLIAPAGTPLDDEGTNLSILSRYPLGPRIDTEHPFYLGGREIAISGRRIRLFSNWFHYDPWEDQPQELGLSVDQLLAWERSGTKWAMFRKVLPELERYAAEADSIPLVFGGDMNAPSHLDWGPATADQHHGLVVPWAVSSKLEQLGLIDAFRQLHPDPVARPGITWNTREAADEHRIDYIYYKGKGLRAVASDSWHAYLGDPFPLRALGPDAPDRTVPYPSDHGLVVTTFELDQKP